MPASLTTVQKAPLLDQDGAKIPASAATISIANTSVCTAVNYSNNWYISAGTPGTTTVTVTRIADGQVATLEVTVVQVPFSVSLGAPVPK